MSKSKLMPDLAENLESFASSKEYSKGYLECKKEYENKLRWIPVEEELPNECTFVLTKYKNTYSVSWYDGEFNEMYNPTHWRPIL